MKIYWVIWLSNEQAAQYACAYCSLRGLMRELQMEYVECNSSRDLRQGDVIMFSKPSYYIFGVVITTDCDIKQDKTRGVIAYLPIVTFDYFLKIYYVVKYWTS